VPLAILLVIETSELRETNVMRRLSFWLMQAGLDEVSLRKMRAAALASADAKKDRPEAGEAIGKDRRPKPPAKFGRNNNEVTTGCDCTATLQTSGERDAGRPIATATRPNTGASPHAPAVAIGLLVLVEGRAHATWP